MGSKKNRCYTILTAIYFSATYLRVSLINVVEFLYLINSKSLHEKHARQALENSNGMNFKRDTNRAHLLSNPSLLSVYASLLPQDIQLQAHEIKKTDQINVVEGNPPTSVSTLPEIEKKQDVLKASETVCNLSRRHNRRSSLASKDYSNNQSL